MALFGGRGKISRVVKNLLTTAQKIELLATTRKVYHEYVCLCPKNDKLANKLALLNSQPETQLERQVNTILYVPGGNTQYGNFLTNAELMAYLEERKLNPGAFLNGRTNFNGQYEGQPGGMRGPIKNKF
uniref:Uncharacterized protein n=1 Tax=viral metagenome TaxID=1070528 RepID=A0A6C0KYK4_9ZZZZ